MSNDQIGQPYPSIPYPFTQPFYYASLTNVGAYYLVPVENVLPFLAGTGLVPYLFDGQAMVTYNFQLYIGNYAAGVDVAPEDWLDSGAGITQEVELNIVCFPENRGELISQVTWQQFIMDGEQGKILGNKRVHVPCDNKLAIQAGKEMFGEPKFYTTFKVNLATPNPVRQDTQPFEPEWVTTWGFRINDPDNADENICTVVVDTNGLTPVPGNFSPITEYGEHDGRLIACRWNILQPLPTFFLGDDAKERVKLTFGTSQHAMRVDMEAMIGDIAPIACRAYSSAPAAINSRAFYP